MEMESPFPSHSSLMSAQPLSSHSAGASASDFSLRSPFMLPELDRLIASHLDQAVLANASRVCRLWHSIFNPVLWRHLALQHAATDDDENDEDFSFISRRASPPSSLASLPSSCSSTWSAYSMNANSPPASPSTSPVPYFHSLTLMQQAFVHSSRNRVLKGLIRHGHLVHDLKATGITDQEMAVIAVLCPSLRVLELIGGRYTAENLADLFQKRRDSIQIIRFRSCVQLKDIFRPLKHLANLREFELYGSFVGNTITSPYFFERDLFPVLSSCPQLRNILIEQVYINDQQIEQGGHGYDIGEMGGGIFVQDHDQDNDSSASSLLSPRQPTPRPLSLTPSTLSSMLSAQLRSSSYGPPARNTHRLHHTSSLKTLTLDCGDIPDSVIMALLTRCPVLERLTLDWSRNLTDASLLSLQLMCPNLTRISLARCVELSDDGFKAFFRSFPNLTAINLNGNILSDGLLEEISRSCQFLQELSINSCQNVTDVGIQAVLLNCAHLSFFSLRFMPGMSYLLFDDIMTPGLSTVTSTPGALSTNPRFTSHSGILHPHRRRTWSCLRSLRSLHLPDLVQPSKAALEKLQQKEIMSPTHSISSSPYQPRLTGDRIIQSRLRQIMKLEHLTIGGHSLDLRVVLDGLESARGLSTLRITKLRRTMTTDDAQWLLKEAVPNLKRLAVPMFGNRGVIEWIENQRPGLLSFER